jgi:hypothetical protein
MSYENDIQSMKIGNNWFVILADFDCDEPYITICNEDSRKEEKMLVPEPLAYYLRTHFCGSVKMHDLIQKNSIRDLQCGIKKLLGL